METPDASARQPLPAPIPLRSLIGNLDPSACKLHCAGWNRVDHPLEVLSTSWEEWLGWNRWRGKTNHFNRQFIFSLAVTHENPTHWIFGGVFEVTGRRDEPDAHSYDIVYRDDILGPYLKRLKIAYDLPGRARRRKLEASLDEMTVREVFSEQYSGKPFPGHDKIDMTLGELDIVFRQHREDWRRALEPMKGVYVIHDTATGKPYVGSAYGDDGIWARWKVYVESLHGHNHELRALVDQAGPEYARRNLRFALLECWSKRTDDAVVLARESYWKHVLLTRGEFGLNAN